MLFNHASEFLSQVYCRIANLHLMNGSSALYLCHLWAVLLHFMTNIRQIHIGRMTCLALFSSSVLFIYGYGNYPYFDI